MRYAAIPILAELVDAVAGIADHRHAEGVGESEIDSNPREMAKPAQIVNLLVARVTALEHRQGHLVELAIEPGECRPGQLPGAGAIRETQHADCHAAARRIGRAPGGAKARDVVLHHEPWLEWAGKHAELHFGGPLVGFGADRRRPQRRVRLLHRARHEFEARESIMFAGVGQGPGPKALAQDRQALCGHIPA